ncbi:hypothetical protein C7457_1329 [Thermovibrio guaymasensis]|uniref:Uncharacterized protein n=1 Tax=Thermovibrio guaymasensis TaxID=240167 RepID=A0A420W733_9BACT|nr:hypothetical protein [Thermovibrio guaymasensis]RKQ61870.1 hypothetical protein C7457_1329 [Thermovibrio guaymasensis]
MRVLITGPLKGNLERLRGLIEVSQPDLTVVIGPLEIKEPLKLERTWFFVRGISDELQPLSKSDGIDLLSRIFRTKEGITFSGLSGVYHPSTEKFTREEWIKAKGKIERKKRNYLFKEDYEALIVPFKNTSIERLDFLVLSDSPEKLPIKRIVEETKPKFVFFPSTTYLKETSGEITFVGLEEISSPKGKYILYL